MMVAKDWTEHREKVLELDPRQLLDQIAASVAKARAALDDEAEGLMYLAVQQVRYDAELLATLVESW